MYERHFSLSRKPFTSFPEPEMLVWAEGHKMARTMLVYGMSSVSGIVVVTGEIGTGKTTILNHLLTQDKSEHALGRLTGAVGLGDDMPAWLLYGFGMDASGGTRTQNLDRLHTWLTKLAGKKRKAVLFIDEAQLLPEHALEELRVIGDMQVHGKPVLQLVLIGQSELARKLNQPSLEQFRQRVISHYHLKPLTPEETISYVRERVQRAGGLQSLFTEDALHAIFERTAGVPRRINILCDTALVYAYGEGKATVDANTIIKVADDRRQSGLLELT